MEGKNVSESLRNGGRNSDNFHDDHYLNSDDDCDCATCTLNRAGLIKIIPPTYKADGSLEKKGIVIPDAEKTNALFENMLALFFIALEQAHEEVTETSVNHATAILFSVENTYGPAREKYDNAILHYAELTRLGNGIEKFHKSMATPENITRIGDEVLSNLLRSMKPLTGNPN